MFYDPKESSVNYDEEVLDKYLDKQVLNYKKQDSQHGRTITDNYITADWLKGPLGKVCCDCGDCLRFDIKDDRAENT